MLTQNVPIPTRYKESLLHFTGRRRSGMSGKVRLSPTKFSKSFTSGCISRYGGNRGVVLLLGLLTEVRSYSSTHPFCTTLTPPDHVNMILLQAYSLQQSPIVASLLTTTKTPWKYSSNPTLLCVAILVFVEACQSVFASARKFGERG
jgi:hypothetical protein